MSDARSQTSKKALASFYLGLFSLVISGLDFLITSLGEAPAGDMITGPFFLHAPLALTAILLAVSARRDIVHRGFLGRNQAVAGALMGVLAIGLIPVNDKIDQSRRAWRWQHQDEPSTVGSLRTINTSEVMYSSDYPKVGFSPDLKSLGGHVPCQPSPEHACLLDEALAAGNRFGYRFTYTATDTHGDGVRDAYRVQADPWGAPSHRHFFTNQTGVIRYDREHPATAASPPLQ